MRHDLSLSCGTKSKPLISSRPIPARRQRFVGTTHELHISTAVYGRGRLLDDSPAIQQP